MQQLVPAVTFKPLMALCKHWALGGCRSQAMCAGLLWAPSFATALSRTQESTRPLLWGKWRCQGASAQPRLLQLSSHRSRHQAFLCPKVCSYSWLAAGMLSKEWTERSLVPTHRVSSEGCLCAARRASLWDAGSAPVYTTPLYTNGLGGSQKCDQKALFISIQNKFKWCFFLRLKIHFLQCFQSLSFSVKNVRCVNAGFWNVSQLATSHKVNWKYFSFCFFFFTRWHLTYLNT